MARSETTTSAPWRRSSQDCPTRSRRMTQPKRPARPASTPARASSKTAASDGSTPSRRAAARNVSGKGFPASFSRSATTPSTTASKSLSRPVTSRTALVLADEETTARGRAGPAGLRRPPAQEAVEHLLPGRGVDGGRLGEDAVEVEEAGVDVVREAEHVHLATERQGREANRAQPVFFLARQALMNRCSSPPLG